MRMHETISEAPRALRSEASVLRTLNAFAIDVMTIPNADDLLWYVAQNVVGRLQFVDCVIYAADPGQTELRQVAALGDKNPFGRNILNPLVIPFGEGITGRVAQSRQPIIVSDLALDSHYVPDTQPARSEICVPLVSRGRVMGVIDSEHPCVGAFGPAELEIFETIAAMTSAKLELLAEAERSGERYRQLMCSHADLTQEVTNRKALEQRLFEARKLEAVGRLSGRFAHEFNNLLTVICGNLDLAEIEASGRADEDLLRNARAAAGRATALVQDLLAYAQRAHLSREVIDINTLVMAATAEFGPGTVQHKLVAGLPPVQVDRAAAEASIRQVVCNATDAAPAQGAVRVHTRLAHVSGHVPAPLSGPMAPGAYVCVSVDDDGTGIAPGLLPQIFDPFFTTKSREGGRGLGLSAVLGFMKQIGGGVDVSSALGKGTTMQMFFPAAPFASGGA